MGDLAAIASAANVGAGGSALQAMLIIAGFAVLVLGYFYITWDKRRDDSPNKEDGQVGLKLAIYALMLVSLGLFAGALADVLGYVISGAKGGSVVIKSGIASILAGGGGFAAGFLLLLPRTNTVQFGQAERFAVGSAMLAAVLAAVFGAQEALQQLFGVGPAGWQPKAYAIAEAAVAGALAFLATSRFGALSGWVIPVRPVAPAVAPQAGYPGQSAGPYGQLPPGADPGYQNAGPGGYPPHGYPQQPNQGGGYPGQAPHGGGYPQSAQGGYPQQPGYGPGQGSQANQQRQPGGQGQASGNPGQRMPGGYPPHGGGGGGGYSPQ